MKVQSAFLATTLAMAMILGACSSNPESGSSGTAGSSSTGGPLGTGGSSSGTGGGSSCPNVTACGGNVVGTWTVSSSCLNVTGNLDVSTFGVGCAPAVSVTGGALQVTGTWTANSNGTYSDNTTTTGTEQITVPPACLTVSGTLTTCDRIRWNPHRPGIRGGQLHERFERRVHVHGQCPTVWRFRGGVLLRVGER